MRYSKLLVWRIFVQCLNTGRMRVWGNWPANMFSDEGNRRVIIKLKKNKNKTCTSVRKEQLLADAMNNIDYNRNWVALLHLNVFRNSNNSVEYSSDHGLRVPTLHYKQAFVNFCSVSNSIKPEDNIIPCNDYIFPA